MQKIYIKTRLFVARHKEALIVSAITLPMIVLGFKSNKTAMNFLHDKNLLDEYLDSL